MNRLRQVLVYTALAWAFVAPYLVYVRMFRETDVARSLRALAPSWPGESQEGQMLAHLAREQEWMDDFYVKITLVHSGVIVGFCCVSMTRFYREKYVT